MVLILKIEKNFDSFKKIVHHGVPYSLLRVIFPHPVVTTTRSFVTRRFGSNKTCQIKYIDKMAYYFSLFWPMHLKLLIKIGTTIKKFSNLLINGALSSKVQIHQFKTNYLILIIMSQKIYVAKVNTEGYVKDVFDYPFKRESNIDRFMDSMR